MKILAIDTAAEVCSVALTNGTEIIERFTAEPRRQAQVLLPYIDELLAEANMTLTQLDAIALSNGPGSFVGLRLGAGIAQGLAFASDLPVIPVSSLAVLAQAAYREKKSENVLVAVNAHMQEVYYGIYAAQKGVMHAVEADSLCQPDVIAIPQGKWLAVGSAWDVYGELREKIINSHAIESTLVSQARDVLTLAEFALQNKQVVTAQELTPFYLRTKSAWRSMSN